MNLYLEALDREVKKETENPSVGVILCASKDDEVVEFALSRSLSPTMVSEYTLNIVCDFFITPHWCEISGSPYSIPVDDCQQTKSYH